MEFTALPRPDYRRLSDLQSGIDDWFSAATMRAYATEQVAAERERSKVLARWISEVLPALEIAEVVMESEDGGEHSEQMVARGKALVEAVLTPNV